MPKRRHDPNNPSSVWYWKDWLNDKELRMCSAAAKGVWMDMLCTAAMSDPYGYMMVGKRHMDTTDVARLSALTVDDAKTIIDELTSNGVLSVDRAGRMFSRRLVKEKKTREESRKNGAKGGNKALMASAGKDDEITEGDNPTGNPQVIPHARASPFTHTHATLSGSYRDADADAEADGKTSEKGGEDDLTFRERILVACGVDASGFVGPNGRQLATQAQMVTAFSWTAIPPQGLGLTEAQVLGVIGEVMARRTKPPFSLSYFADAMADLAAAMASPPPAIDHERTSHAVTTRRSERLAAGRAIEGVAAGLSAGEIRLSTSGRDPFA